jgi:tetratricopeptide (TPR) repeat protein
MLTPKVRLALCVAFFALGAYWVVAGRYAGLLFLVASAYLAYGYFKYGTVWLAFREVAHGRMAEAAQLLAKVKQPEALGPEERAYFELAWGLVCASRAENPGAEAHLKIALGNRLRTDNDRALAEAVLAQLLLARGARDEAVQVLAKAAIRECRPSIAQRIKTLQEELSGS